MLVKTLDQDLPAVAALIKRAYARSRSSCGRFTEDAYLSGDRTTEALLRADLLNKPAARLLKWSDPGTDEPLGCLWLEPLTDRTWYLGSLATAPDRQNRGFGSTLLCCGRFSRY